MDIYRNGEKITLNRDEMLRAYDEYQRYLHKKDLIENRLPEFLESEEMDRFGCDEEFAEAVLDVFLNINYEYNPNPNESENYESAINIVKKRFLETEKKDPEYLRVGMYVKYSCGDTYFRRGYYGQGWIYKNEEAFLNHPDQVCYIPELSDNEYTRNDFLRLFGGNEKLATECFYAVDWQHPEVYIDEQVREGVWIHDPKTDTYAYIDEQVREGEWIYDPETDTFGPNVHD